MSAAPGEGLDVLVPVYNGHDALAACLASLARHVAAPHRVLLLDDASSDARIVPMLEAAAKGSPHFQVLRGESNLGFVGNVNRGLERTAGDVVLLNADTIVTAGWLERLARCRDSDPAIGVVCPLSNNATLLTIPDVVEVGASLGPDGIAEAIARAARPEYPRIPTAVGSCMLVTRKALAACGHFDAAFAPGYGEENDFSMRARRAGFAIACADDTYIHHHGGASFGGTEGIDAKRARNAATLAARWPDYEPETRGFMRRMPLRAPLERARAAVASAATPGRIRILQVANRFDAYGGIEEHVRMLVNRLRERHQFTVLDNASQPRLWGDVSSRQVTPTVRHLRHRAENLAASPILFGGPSSLMGDAVDGCFSQILEGGGIDLVHLQSLMPWGSLRFAEIARALGIPTVLSMHDFFILCPDYNQIHIHTREHCGRARATAEDPDCSECIFQRQFPIGPRLAREQVGPYLVHRNAAVARLLEACAALVVPSRFLADKVARAYPAMAAKIEVIAHGVEGVRHAPPPAGNARLRVVALGRFNERKGAAPVIAAAHQLKGQVDFEVLGHTDKPIEAYARDAGIKLRGPYSAPQIPELLAGVDLVLIPTLMEETFSLVLSEAQAAGVPVAATAMGAMPERVEHGRTGFLLPAGNVDALVAFLAGLVADRSPLERVRRELAGRPARTAADSARDYERLYDRVLAQRPSASAAGVQRAVFPLATSPQGPGTAAYAKLREIQAVQLAALPEGANADWIVALAPGTTLHPDFSRALAGALERSPSATVAFADEDRITTRGERYAPVFKTAWDASAPARWMPGAIVAFRRDAALAAGGLQGVGPEANAVLARRLAERHGDATVIHLPFVLGHVADAPPEAPVVPTPPRPVPARAAAVALYRHGGFDACLRLLDGLLLAARGNEVTEILVPFTAPEWARAQELLRHRSLAGVRALAFDAIAPKGVALNDALNQASADIVIFLRDDSEIAAAERLAALAAPFADARVAAVAGAFAVVDLAGRENTRDAAFALGFGPEGVADAPLPQDAAEPWHAQPLLQGRTRPVSAFASHAFALRRAAALAAGGFEARAPLARHLTTDLALRLAAAGGALLALPEPVVRVQPGAIENAAIWGDAKALDEEAAWMIRRHGTRLASDPWYPASLSRGRTGFVPEAEVVAPPGWLGEGPRRIVAVPFDAWGSGQYRVRTPMAALERAGRARVAMMPTHDSGRIPNATEMLALDPGGVLAHAALHDYQLQAARAWKRHLKVPLAFGLDDLLTAIPPWNPYHYTLYRDIAQRIAAALAVYDRIVVSTAPIAESIKALRRDVHVIPNAIDPDRWGRLRMAPREEGRTRVGWAGARQHAGDLEWLRPAIEATRESVDWVFLGDCPDSLLPLVAEYHPMVPVDRYPEALAGLALDLAIAPLADHPFNHAKSNVKLLELGALGCPVIASDVTPYRGAPVVRLPNDPESWRGAILERTADRQALRAEGLALRNWVYAEYSLPVTLADWYNLLG